MLASITTDYISTDLASRAMWFAVALGFITVITKVVRGTILSDPVRNTPLPPVVNGGSIIQVLYTLFTRGFQAMIHDQYTKFGSVFTISFFGIKFTFLIGPEVSGHFYQGPESEIGNIREFTVPMIGKDVSYGVDIATRNEQSRFYIYALKPTNLRCHVGPMLQEVKDYFAKWGQEGMVDLKQELEQLLMLISARCLLGKEVREKMFDDVITLFHEMIDKGMCLTSVLFPHAPTPVHQRRDRAHAKLWKMFSEIVRTRKSTKQVVESDVLQNIIDSKYRDGRSTTESEVIGMIIGLLIAGRHSSSATSMWTGVDLLSHVKWLAAAVEEQKQVSMKYGNQIDYSILKEMDILHRCIKETLRMHPPGPAFFHKVHKSFTVKTKEGKQYEIPRGHMIVSPILFNHNIPYIYKEPEVYNPDRFGPGREEDKVGGKFSYTAFGGGRHACIGEAYAYMQIKVIWSHLLRTFELKLVSAFPQTDWRMVVPGPKGKVMVCYKMWQLPIP